MATTFEPIDPNADPFAEAAATAVTDAPIVDAKPKTAAPADTKVAAPVVTLDKGVTADQKTAMSSMSPTAATGATAFEPIDPNADPFADATQASATATATSPVALTRAEQGLGPTYEEEQARLREAYSTKTADIKLYDIPMIEALDYADLYERASRPDEVGKWLSAHLEGRGDSTKIEEILQEKADNAQIAGRRNENGVLVPEKYKELLVHEPEDIAIARQLLNGVMFEWGDEATALVQSGVTGEPYQKKLDEINTRMKQFEGSDPTLAMIVNVGGAVATAIATAGVGAYVSGGRMVASGATRILSKESGKAILGAAAAGAVENTVTGAGSRATGEKLDAGSMLSDAAWGGVLSGGLVTGVKAAGVFGPVARAVGAVIGGPSHKALGSGVNADRSAGVIMAGALEDAKIDLATFHEAWKRPENSNLAFGVFLAKYTDERGLDAAIETMFPKTAINAETTPVIGAALNSTIGDLSFNMVTDINSTAMRISGATDPDTLYDFISRGVDGNTPLTQVEFDDLRNSVGQITHNFGKSVRDDVFDNLGLEVGKLADLKGTAKILAKLNADAQATGERLGNLRLETPADAALTSSVLNEFAPLDKAGNIKPNMVGDVRIKVLNQQIGTRPGAERLIWKGAASQREDVGFTYTAKYTPFLASDGKDASLFLDALNKIPDVAQRRTIGQSVGGLIEGADGSFVVAKTKAPDEAKFTRAISVDNTLYESLPPDLQKALDDDLAYSPEQARITELEGSNYVSLPESKLTGSSVDLIKKKMTQILKVGQAPDGTAETNEMVKKLGDVLNYDALNDEVTALGDLNLEYRELASTVGLTSDAELPQFIQAIGEAGSSFNANAQFDRFKFVAKRNPEGAKTILYKVFEHAKYLEDLTNMTDAQAYGLATIMETVEPNGLKAVERFEKFKAIRESATTVTEITDGILEMVGATNSKSPLIMNIKKIAADAMGGGVNPAVLEGQIKAANLQSERLIAYNDRLKSAFDNGILPQSADLSNAIAATDAELKKLSEVVPNLTNELLRFSVAQTVHGLSPKNLDKSIEVLTNLSKDSKVTDLLLQGLKPDDLVSARNQMIEVRNMATGLKKMQKLERSLDPKSTKLIADGMEAVGIGAANLGGTNPTIPRFIWYIVGRAWKTASQGVRNNNTFRFNQETIALSDLLNQNFDDDAIGKYFLPILTGKPAEMSMEEFMKKELFSASNIRNAFVMVASSPTEEQSQASE